MQTVTTTFREIKIYGQKTVRCAGNCGRTLKRQCKFWQTLSPFNKTRAGTPKTVEDIQLDLRAENLQWQKEVGRRLAFREGMK